MNDRHEHYQNRVTIDADRERVFAALTTVEGIEGWWGSACSGAFEVGCRFDVRFGSAGHSLMEVTHLAPNEEVHWACIESTESDDADDARPDEWAGTTLIWRLSPGAGGRATTGAAGATDLWLEHVGLTPVLGCFEECNDIWNRLLPGSLKPYVETGVGSPARAA